MVYFHVIVHYVLVCVRKSQFSVIKAKTTTQMMAEGAVVGEYHRDDHPHENPVMGGLKAGCLDHAY